MKHKQIELVKPSCYSHNKLEEKIILNHFCFYLTFEIQ